MAEPRIVTLTGDAVAPHLPALARLRQEVFRAWPYLYAGSADEEARYLQTYAQRRDFALIVALDNDTPIGAATCLPLVEESENVRAPFLGRGWDPGRFFYYGESVLLPAWRGRGIGVAFFAAREAHARAVSSCDFAAFCAVQRPDNHPARPPDAPDLRGFWAHRGFTPYPGLACVMRWTDIGDPAPTDKTLGFWLKSLSGAPLP
jgi:GNAT superfamily N-acetyltransferase